MRQRYTEEKLEQENHGNGVRKTYFRQERPKTFKEEMNKKQTNTHL